MIKGFDKFVKESVENKGKGVGGGQDLFPSAPFKQTINRSNPTMDFLRVGKHILTKKIDGFIDSVQNEGIFITDRITGEIKKYTLKEVLKELTQNKDDKGPSTVQGFEGTPAWAVKQKIYESNDDDTVLLGETYEPQRQREFMPDPDEVETQQEQELEYGSEEEPEIEYGDEEEDDNDGGNDADLGEDAPDNAPSNNINNLNINNAEKRKLLHGTEDNPEGLPNKGNSREMPNESWVNYWENFNQKQVKLVTEDLEEEDEVEEDEVEVRGTEDNPIPARRKTKIENYE